MTNSLSILYVLFNCRGETEWYQTGINGTQGTREFRMCLALQSVNYFSKVTIPSLEASQL